LIIDIHNTLVEKIIIKRNNITLIINKMIETQGDNLTTNDIEYTIKKSR